MTTILDNKARIGTNTGTGLKGLPVEKIIERFYGDLKQWPIEYDGINWTQNAIKVICQRISDTGDCLWHAQAVMMVWTNCHCAKCQGVQPHA